MWQSKTFLANDVIHRRVLESSALVDKGWIKVVIILAAVFGVFQGLLLLWDRFGPSPDRLVAVVRYGPFELPTEVLSNYEKTLENLNASEINKLLEKYMVPSQKAGDENARIRTTLALDLAGALKETVSEAKPSCALDSEGFQTVDLANEGSRALKSIVVTLDSSARCVLVKAPTEPGKFTTRNDSNSLQRIEIGTLQPQETARVVVWLYSDGLYPYAAREVRVTHESGIGTITVIEPVGTVARFIDKYGLWSALALLAGVQLWVIWKANFESSQLRKVLRKNVS